MKLSHGYDGRTGRATMSTPDRDITALLQQIEAGGDREALDRLLPLVYRELRELAGRQFRREDRGHTLQPTALVHEAYLRLVDQRAGYASRLHFFRVAAMMMRRVLVDRARERGAGGARGERVELAERAEPTAAAAPVDLLALDQALSRLEQRDERKVRIVELRYFAARTIAETAEILGISEATVSRDWEVARLWLLRELDGGE